MSCLFVVVVVVALLVLLLLLLLLRLFFLFVVAKPFAAKLQNAARTKVELKKEKKNKLTKKQNKEEAAGGNANIARAEESGEGRAGKCEFTWQRTESNCSATKLPLNRTKVATSSAKTEPN